MSVNICYLELIFILMNFLLAVETDEKEHTDRDIIFEKKRQKALEKKIPLKNIPLEFMKSTLIFINIMKKIQADKNGCKNILFRIDIYFRQCF